jgi:mono/diheme cytochrome c family protein
MKPVRLEYNLLCALYVCLVVSCNEKNNQQRDSNNAAPTELGSIVTNLPDAPGYATFKNNCVSCHSAQYVKMQPDLPEKTWTALVTKMQKTFGAPIPDSSVKEIVQYLVTIRGKS